MIGIVLGTRPEIIKMSPLIRECERRDAGYYILHTGQHYSFDMDRAFFEQLELPEPDLNLDVGSGHHGEQTGRILAGIEKVIMSRETDELLVQGDTNTVMAGALAAAKLHVRVGHVEAGLRSYDRNMPEEINRLVADHVSDHLFAPTEGSNGNLLKEGIDEAKIFVTGNTIVDSVFQNLEISRKRADPFSQFGIEKGRYVLLTSHRAENVDVPKRFDGILRGVSDLGEELGIPVVYPIHPRAKKFLSGDVSDNIRIVDPVPYMEFLQLEEGASLIVTDSGGLQEEACILKVPCVTVRDNTERPETVAVGANVLAGTDPARILEHGLRMHSARREWDNPFGDPGSAGRILDIINE
jgi:UDP-N-acetylglucosamine 2-epimerase (non-hydrolysing)